jgi:phosphonate transport system permease protein
LTVAIPRPPSDRMAVLLGAYRAEQSARRRRSLLFVVVLLVCVALASQSAEVDIDKLVAGLPRFWSYIADIVPKLSLTTFFDDVAEWYWNAGAWLTMLVETLLVAYVGTALGCLGGFVLCFLASANMTGNATVRFVARRFLELCRTVPELVFALLFVYAMGLGPVPGVLAIAIHTAGALGKQFAEVVENIDMNPVDGVASTGAGWISKVRFAVLPQVLSNFVSYTLLRFEINVRGAAIMGFVGAGGIGKELLMAIRQFYYADVSAILLMIILTVVLIDLLTERLRHQFLAREAAR